jgi:hypothetical protein
MVSYFIEASHEHSPVYSWLRPDWLGNGLELEWTLHDQSGAEVASIYKSGPAKFHWERNSTVEQYGLKPASGIEQTWDDAAERIALTKPVVPTSAEELAIAAKA